VPLVELRGVHKTYRLGESRIEALRGVDFSLEAGEFTAIWGPSGSGKTTLCNVVGLLDEATSGEVYLQGEPAAKLSDDARADFRNRSLGFIFQRFNLIPVLTAVENVMLPLQLRGVAASEARASAVRGLERLGLAGHLRHRPDKLSGGQQQRVAIARAIVGEPAIVIADEPTANLDSETARDLIDLLHGINRENGTTFLIATHDQRLLERVERRVLLRDGAVASDEAR